MELSLREISYVLHVHALMCARWWRKSWAVGMRNAILRNYLNLLFQNSCRSRKLSLLQLYKTFSSLPSANFPRVSEDDTLFVWSRLAEGYLGRRPDRCLAVTWRGNLRLSNRAWNDVLYFSSLKISKTWPKKGMKMIYFELINSMYCTLMNMALLKSYGCLFFSGGASWWGTWGSEFMSSVREKVAEML